MIKTKTNEVIDVNELVEGLEKILNKSSSDDIALIRKAIKAIDVLKKGTKIQVGENELIIISGDVFQVKKSNMAVFPPITSIKETDLDEQYNDKYVSTKDVAEYYNVTTETVRDWIEKDIIPAHRVGERGRYKIPRAAFEYMRKRRDESIEEVEDIMKRALGDNYDENWEFDLSDEDE